MSDWLDPETDGDPRQEIEAVLIAGLEETRRQIAKVHPSGVALVDEITDLIGAGGKRVRPLLCYWGHMAAGGAHCDPILRVAASLELLHAFALLHDDLMDGSTMRRGRPAAHVRVDPAFAILCGDLAFCLSDAMLWGSGFPPAAIRTAAYHLHQMRLETLVGQNMDLQGSATTEDSLAAARLKTGSYTITGPLKIGASLAGAGPEHLRALERYGAGLGEAYQLADDLEGVFEPERSGKDPRDPSRPASLILRAAETGSPVPVTEDQGLLRRHLVSADVPAWALSRIRDLVADAKAALGSQDAVTLQPRALVVLNQVADSMVERSERIQIGPEGLRMKERGRF